MGTGTWKSSCRPWRGTARRRIIALSTDGVLPDVGTDILADGQTIGRLGSSADGHGIGLVRLDRLKMALDAGRRISAGATDVAVSLPEWAAYSWPGAAAAEE